MQFIRRGHVEIQTTCLAVVAGSDDDAVLRELRARDEVLDAFAPAADAERQIGDGLGPKHGRLPVVAFADRIRVTEIERAITVILGGLIHVRDVLLGIHQIPPAILRHDLRSDVRVVCHAGRAGMAALGRNHDDAVRTA